MSKFLYPIYKLNIESYKKWWLYHKKAGGSGILSEILQGFSFNLEDTLNRKFKLFEIEGNSVQDGTPSSDNEVPIKSAGDNENLLPNNIISQTKNGVAITKNNDGTLTFNGTSTEGFVLQIGTVTIGEDGEYTLSGCPSGGSLQSYFIYNMAGTPDVTDIGNGKTKALNKNDYLNMYINIRANQTFNDLVFKPKLEKGNKATPYSPYGMGSINEKIQTRNLWNLNSSYSSTGYATLLNQANFKLKKGNYILSFEKVTVTSSILFRFFNKDKSSYYDARVTPTSKTPILNALEDIYYVTLIFNEADSLEGIQLEPGTTESSYVPHEEQDYSIEVQQPMRSIGDVRDGFVKVNGVWNEVHLIGNKILNGSEGWSKQNTSSTSNSLFICWGYITNPGKATACPNSYGVLSNYFKKVTENIWTGAYKGIDVYGNQAFICVSNDIATTVDDFKRWLNTHNVEVNYVLQNPTYLPCTETQIQQIENKPSTYKDFTIIQSEDEIEAHLKIQYWKEVQS